MSDARPPRHSRSDHAPNLGARRAAVEAIVGSVELYDRAIARARGTLDRLGFNEEQRAVNAYVAAAIFAQMSGIQWLVSV